MIQRLACCLLVLTSIPSPCWGGQEWPSFRGPEGSGSDPSANVPTEWDVEKGTNIAWRAELVGRGVSGPIIVDGRVFVTASSGNKRDRLHVLALDSSSGEQLWHRQFWAAGRTLMHSSTANAAPTPTCDGERVYAFYSSNDLVCLDLEGNLQWMRCLSIDHPGVGNDVGMASSPTVVGDVVVVLCQCQGNSFCAAFDRKTGAPAWEISRPTDANWSTPIAITTKVNGSDVEGVVLQSSRQLEVVDAKSGKLLWKLPVRCSVIPTAAMKEGILYMPGSGLTAVAINPIESDDRVVWRAANLQAGNTSPVAVNDQILMINSAGVLTSASMADGKVEWRRRLKLDGTLWASPVVAGRYLYCVTDRGSAAVVDIEDKGHIVATGSFGKNQQVLASPAIAGDALYVRSYKYLWKIAAPQ